MLQLRKVATNQVSLGHVKIDDAALMGLARDKFSGFDWEGVSRSAQQFNGHPPVAGVLQEFVVTGTRDAERYSLVGTLWVTVLSRSIVMGIEWEDPAPVVSR